ARAATRARDVSWSTYAAISMLTLSRQDDPQIAQISQMKRFTGYGLHGPRHYDVWATLQSAA
ncbi:MAG TPA: hypothetical protein VM223_11255, partial [Planctomycetota bacterium]|nr:hypothetical protein [Planctomycetota bacterium]